jgi:hypothetical protein
MGALIILYGEFSQLYDLKNKISTYTQGLL